MKTKGASTRVDRFPPATCPVDPKINALLEVSRVRCSCVSNGDFDSSCPITSWAVSSEEIKACHHKNRHRDNLVQVVLASRGSSRLAGLPKKTGSAPPTSHGTHHHQSVPPAQKLGSRQAAARKKQKPSEFQHFMTAAEHIGWYRESYTSCPTLGQIPHFSRTFHPSLSIAQANTISIDNDIGRCDYSELASSSTAEVRTEQLLHVVKRPASSQLPSVTTANTQEDRNSDHLSGITSADKNFYPSPVTFQEPSNGFISSFFPKLHRSSYYRAHTQRKLLYRGSRLLELYPRTIYGNIDIEKIRGLQYLQPRQLAMQPASCDVDDIDADDDENCEEDDSQASQHQDSVSSVECTDQSINGTYSSFTWEVDNSSSNIVLPFLVDDGKQTNPSLKMAMKKLSMMQRRRYTFPTYPTDKKQDSPKQFEVTGIHYTTLVSPMGTVPRLPKNSTTAKQLAKRRSKQGKNTPVLHQMISMSGNRSVSDRSSKSPYTETSKHIFPFKNESENCYKTNYVNSERYTDPQQRDVNLHNNCINKTRRRVLHKYLATRLQKSASFDRLSQHKPEQHSVKLGIIMPHAKESLQAAQESSQ